MSKIIMKLIDINFELSQSTNKFYRNSDNELFSEIV